MTMMMKHGDYDDGQFVLAVSVIAVMHSSETQNN